MTNLKIRIVALIFIGVGAVLLYVKGYNDEENLYAASDSFNELYSDRLMAEHYIFRMNDLIHEKKWLLRGDEITGADPEQGKDLQKQKNRQLLETFSKFSHTKLSIQEKAQTLLLNKQITSIEQQEGKPHASQLMLYDNTLATLEQLSNIQVAEGSKLKISGQSHLSSYLLGIKLQWAAYFIMLLSVIALLKTFSVRSRVVGRHELN